MTKRLTKGKKMIFGVCSGLANHLNLDPTLMRVAFVFTFFFFGAGLLFYLVLALVMPER